MNLNSLINSRMTIEVGIASNGARLELLQVMATHKYFYEEKHYRQGRRMIFSLQFDKQRNDFFQNGRFKSRVC
eukprot:1906898-Amphidinium_carterae.1